MASARVRVFNLNLQLKNERFLLHPWCMRRQGKHEKRRLQIVGDGILSVAQRCRSVNLICQLFSLLQLFEGIEQFHVYGNPYLVGVEHHIDALLWVMDSDAQFHIAFVFLEEREQFGGQHLVYLS